MPALANTPGHPGDCNVCRGQGQEPQLNLVAKVLPDGWAGLMPDWGIDSRSLMGERKTLDFSKNKTHH